MRERLRLFVENRAEELVAQGILADFGESIKISNCWSPGTVITTAETSLLVRPQMPVAIILNETDPFEESGAIATRMLSQSASSDKWHVALAKPDMTTWLRAAPNFMQAVRSDLLKTDPTKIELAVFFHDWNTTAGQHIDRQAIAAAIPEFRELNNFIELHLNTTAKVA